MNPNQPSQPMDIPLSTPRTRGTAQVQSTKLTPILDNLRLAMETPEPSQQSGPQNQQIQATGTGDIPIPHEMDIDTDEIQGWDEFSGVQRRDGSSSETISLPGIEELSRPTTPDQPIPEIEPTTPDQPIPQPEPITPDQPIPQPEPYSPGQPFPASSLKTPDRPIPELKSPPPLKKVRSVPSSDPGPLKPFFCFHPGCSRSFEVEEKLSFHLSNHDILFPLKKIPRMPSLDSGSSDFHNAMYQDSKKGPFQ